MSAQSRGIGQKAFTLLDRIEETSPSALDFGDKRYAAHVEAGQALQIGGNPLAAVDEFVKARSIDPGRSEAIRAQPLARGQ